LTAASAVAGFQGLEDRPRSLLLMSSAQLVDAYRFPDLEQPDLPVFRPKDLLEGGTLYLIAPESEQELLAPLFGGILGAVLRGAARSGRPRRGVRWNGPLRILADEAAHLAPLAKLPTYLAVSGGWGVRWCVVYQSLAQIRHRYGDEADAVLGNLLCKLVLGPVHDAEETRRYVEELLDEEVTTSTSRSRNGGFSSEVSTTTHERRAAKGLGPAIDAAARGEAGVRPRPRPAGDHAAAACGGIARTCRGERLVMTASSIPASSSGGYAHYLDSRTVAPDRGDYYIGDDGAPAGGAGRWLTSSAALGRLGIERTESVRAEDLRALMEGRRPGNRGVAAAGRPGRDPGRRDRRDVLGAEVGERRVGARRRVDPRHGSRPRTTVRCPGRSRTCGRRCRRRWMGPGRQSRASCTRAEFLHTTSRGVAGQVPDPQLHSHVVIASVERTDGAVAALRVASGAEGGARGGRLLPRPACARAARTRLQHRTGRQRGALLPRGGVDEEVERAFSRRTEEVRRAAAEFRARTGREPQRGELRALAVTTRSSKLPQNRAELDRAWQEEARARGLDGDVQHTRTLRPGRGRGASSGA